jgi:hypothetical protein
MTEESTEDPVKGWLILCQHDWATRQPALRQDINPRSAYMCSFPLKSSLAFMVWSGFLLVAVLARVKWNLCGLSICNSLVPGDAGFLYWLSVLLFRTVCAVGVPPFLCISPSTLDMGRKFYLNMNRTNLGPHDTAPGSKLKIINPAYWKSRDAELT